MTLLPLSAGIPFGLVVFLVGAGLFFFSEQRKIAIALLGLGFLISLCAVAMIIMVANSNM